MNAKKYNLIIQNKFKIILDGKLASLEEFRAAREELNNKFVIQEQTMKEQEEKYHQIIYSLQKEHMLSKNK